MSAERYLRWDGRIPGIRPMSVLWPVEVWTFLAPDATRALNVFQEGILGLLRAGVWDRQKMAEMLSLDPDLVAFILAHELIQNRWVDSKHKVTPEGERLLSGRLDRDSNLTLQYAFRDSLFGSWIPRVSKDLPDISPIEGGGGKFPAFRASREGGGVIKPFVLPRREKAGQASKSEVLNAWRTCLRDKANAADERDDVAQDIHGDDIEFVGDAPSLAYVWCEIFHKPGDLQPWLVTDPWRMTPAAKWLRQPLQEKLQTIPALSERILRVLPEADSNEMTADDLRAQIDREVEFQLLKWPALATPEFALLREHMARVLRQRSRIEAQASTEQEELGSLIQECSSLLEAFVQWMLERWPVVGIEWPRDGRNRRVAYEMLEGLPLKSELPQSTRDLLAGQDLRDVRLAALQRDRAFKALLFAALLSAHCHDEHPFRALDPTSLQWERLFSLINLRNKGSHASGRQLDRNQVLQEAAFSFDWIGNFSSYF